MIKKPTIALVAITAHTINSFMLKNIEYLNKKYNLLIFCNDISLIEKKIPKNISLININFKRKFNLVSDIVSFFIILYNFLKLKPKLTISITPKAGFLTALASFIARISYRLHWFTGQTWVTKKGLVRFVYKISEKLIFNLSHHVLVDSHSQKNFLIANNIITKEKSTVLLCGSVGGVNIKKFKYKKKSKNILKKLKISKKNFIFLYLGRLNKDKGILDLIQAFNDIQKNYNTTLILVGPIEEINIVEIIKKCRNIIHIGQTLVPEKWFSIANILCLPSYREGFGSVIIEAGACSLPALGSNIYGIQDAIIKNKTGFFHKVGSVKDLKKKMIFAIKNKKLLKKYGKMAKKRVILKFEEKLIGKKLLEFVNSKLYFKTKLIN